LSYVSKSEWPVYVRDKCTCRYCGLCGLDDFDIWMNLSIDHIVPSAGDSAENTAIGCCHCNSIKNKYKPNGNTREERIADARKYVEKQRDLCRKEFRRMMEEIKNSN